MKLSIKISSKNCLTRIHCSGAGKSKSKIGFQIHVGNLFSLQTTRLIISRADDCNCSGFVRSGCMLCSKSMLPVT